MTNAGGIIIGGGIAGLTASLAMRQAGIKVCIYESAPEIKALGAGIWMAPNAMQVFHRLGIADKINAGGVPLDNIQVVDRSFVPIMRTNQADIRARFGYTTTAIKRSRLQEILLAEVGEQNISLSKTCASLKEENDGVTVSFSDGTTISADFVIGADGIHSAVREHLFPPVQFTQTGYIVWRGISELQLQPQFKKAIIESWHGGMRFGFSEVADGVVDWFAVQKATSSNAELKGMKASLLNTFHDFSYPVADILQVAEERKMIKNVLTDFQPLAHWHRGKICLIGDAAHASTPYMGQGGCQAVEDAYVIAQCLQKEINPEKAFEQLEKIRKRKAIQIVKTSRMMGRVGYMRQSVGALRNLIIRSTPWAVTRQQFIRVYSLNY